MKKMKKIHLLPNIITAFGLLCGLFVIFKINMTEVGAVDFEVLKVTAGLLLLGAFADVLDGAVARAMKAESEFGGLFDCLADAITFGVAPAIIILKSLSLTPGTELSFLLTTSAMVYALCGVLRLVRFSVTSQQAVGDQVLMDAHSKNFTGLPIPAAAAAAVSGNLFLMSDDFNRLMTLSDTTRAWILIVQMLILGYFMISRWKFLSLKRLHIRVASFQLVFLTVVVTVFIFYGLLQHFSIVFAALSWGYILIAWILSIIRLISGKKSKTLEDFEPEPEMEMENENESD